MGARRSVLLCLLLVAAGCAPRPGPPPPIGAVAPLDPRPANPAQEVVVRQALAAELRAAEENERPGRRPQLVVLPLPPEAEAADTLFVQIWGDRWCGSDGCTAWVISGRGGAWQVVSRPAPRGGTPEMAGLQWGIADQSFAGLPDLVARAPEGEGNACRRFRFDGRHYAPVTEGPNPPHCTMLAG